MHSLWTFFPSSPGLCKVRVLSGGCSERRAVSQIQYPTMLLLWAPSITPHPPSNLAAVRFGAQVCIEYIRIVPKGTRAFLKEPLSVGCVVISHFDVTIFSLFTTHSHTKPSLFSLEVMFNQQGMPAVDGAPKIPVNALSPSRCMSYKGEMLDYMIGMDSQVGLGVAVYVVQLTHFGQRSQPES